MTIAIWDLDWFEKTTTMPNVGCMKLSSYHQQKGNTIVFIQDITDLNIAYDRLCIFKERNDTPINYKPYLTMPTTSLFGKGFTYYKVSKLGKIIWACRPDYLLYPKTVENAYTNANIITFFCGTERLNQFQDFHNTNLHHKKTIVADKEFWNTADEDLLWCFNYLKQEKNIAFSEPISLRKLIGNTVLQQKFLDLNFSTGTEFRWRNNLGDDIESAQKIVYFMLQLREKTKSRLGAIPFRATTVPDYGQNDVAPQVIRCLQISKLFKENKLECLFIAPPKSCREFELLEKWTRTSFKLSFVEFILHFRCLVSGATWSTILNNPSSWDSPDILFLVSLLVNPTYKDYQENLFVQWGYSQLNSNLVQRDILETNLSLLYKEKPTDE